MSQSSSLITQPVTVAQLPSVLGQLTMSNSLSVTLASNQSAISVIEGSVGTTGATAPTKTTQIGGVDDSGNLIVPRSRPLNVPVTGTDNGLVTHSVMHGLTTAGGGSYVDVKVTPSGALSVATTINDGTDTALVTAAGELNVLATAQPGVDIGDVTINNAAGASAVNIQDGGNSITVDGTVAISGSVAVTGPLTDTQLRTSAVPVSLTSTTITGTVAVTDNSGSLTVDAPVATPVFVRLSDGAAAISTLPVSLASVPSHAVTNAGTFAVQATCQANSGVDIGDVTINNAAGASAVNVQDGGNSLTVDGTVTITPPTLTKGTQDATGLSVQNLKDAGRTAKRYYAVAAAAGTTGTETAITLTHSSQDAATATGTSFTPTNGKTFRITAISFATRGHATATAQTTTFNLRMNTAGAVTTTSTPILLSMRSATPATASAWDRVYVEIPDGIEIYGNGTKQWGVTAAATYTTNAPTWDVTIIGFEY